MCSIVTGDFSDLTVFAVTSRPYTATSAQYSRKCTSVKTIQQHAFDLLKMFYLVTSVDIVSGRHPAGIGMWERRVCIRRRHHRHTDEPQHCTGQRNPKRIWGCNRNKN